MTDDLCKRLRTNAEICRQMVPVLKRLEYVNAEGFFRAAQTDEEAASTIEAQAREIADLRAKIDECVMAVEPVDPNDKDAAWAGTLPEAVRATATRAETAERQLAEAVTALESIRDHLGSRTGIDRDTIKVMRFIARDFLASLSPEESGL